MKSEDNRKLRVTGAEARRRKTVIKRKERAKDMVTFVPCSRGNCQRAGKSERKAKRTEKETARLPMEEGGGRGGGGWD